MESDLFPSFVRPSVSLLPWRGLKRIVAASIAGLLIAAALALAVGPDVESRFFPILSHQVIPAESVSRSGHSLCWTWNRDKVRAPELLDLDVTLDTADGDSYAPEVVDAQSGIPWHKGGALPAGHYASRFCTTVESLIPAGTPVRLRQTIVYQGFLKLWTIRVPMPEIIAD